MAEILLIRRKTPTNQSIIHFFEHIHTVLGNAVNLTTFFGAYLIPSGCDPNKRAVQYICVFVQCLILGHLSHSSVCNFHPPPPPTHETRCTSGFLLPWFLNLNFLYNFDVWMIAKTTVMFTTDRQTAVSCFKCLCVSEQLFCHLKMYGL